MVSSAEALGCAPEALTQGGPPKWPEFDLGEAEALGGGSPLHEEEQGAAMAQRGGLPFENLGLGSFLTAGMLGSLKDKGLRAGSDKRGKDGATTGLTTVF